MHCLNCWYKTNSRGSLPTGRLPTSRSAPSLVVAWKELLALTSTNATQPPAVPPKGALGRIDADSTVLARVWLGRLICAARASVAAERLHLDDPLSYVRAELSRYGGLPPEGAAPQQLVADAAAGDALAVRLVSS
jgi:hypothetical protein